MSQLRSPGAQLPARRVSNPLARCLALAAALAMIVPACAPGGDGASHSASPGLSAEAAAVPVDTEMVARIREEGLERSQVGALYGQLVDHFGPRLTASPAFNESAGWARDLFAEWGLANARLESFEFGPGWTLEKLTAEMTAPRYLPLIAFPRAWSPSTPGRVEAVPVLIGEPTEEELARHRGKLRGAIVMARPVVDDFIREDRVSPRDMSPDEPDGAPAPAPVSAAEETERERRREERRRQGEQRRALADLLRQEGAAVTLEPSRGEHGTVFVLGQGRDDEGDVPTLVLAGEHYNMLARMLERGMQPRVAVEIQARFHRDDTNGHNVIAEIPGADPEVGDEVVMIGAHLDSWHSAQGATDNADGSAVVMEAMRILKALGAAPRRTIRAALWGGEEQGLIGSRQYVARHLEGDPEAFENFSVYFNLDPGYGPVHGFFLEGVEEVRPWFEANLAPFADLDADTLTMRGIGSTDHLSFRRAGLPGFQPIHSYHEYDVRTHHTNVDTWERVAEEDLKQASVVIASLLWHAAQRDEKFVRPQPPDSR